MARHQGGVAPAGLAIDLLRSHLEEVGFLRWHKFVVTVRGYLGGPRDVWDPAVLSEEASVSTPAGEAGLELAACLALDLPVRYERLGRSAQEVARELVSAGLLAPDGDQLRMGDYQLISAAGRPMLIDARLYRADRGLPEVYAGPDDLLLSYYIGADAVASGRTGLCLATGAGLNAVSLAKAGVAMRALDPDPAAIRLAAANGRLNGCDTLDVHLGGLDDALAAAGGCSLVVGRLPTLPLPGHLNAPSFLRGEGTDGLDGLRRVLGELSQRLVPDGIVLLAAMCAGGTRGPFLASDAPRLAREAGLDLEIYVEHALDLDRGRTVSLLRRFDPAEEDMSSAIRRHLRETLQADCIYFVVTVAQPPRGPSPRARVITELGNRPEGPFRPAE